MTLLQTAAQLACADIYDPITPNVFEKIYRVGESVWGLARIDGTAYIVAQGTELTENGKPSLAGWEADFDALPVDEPILGALHSGFNENTAMLVGLIMADVKPTESIIFCGHSKGAAEAPIGAARMYLQGYHMIQCILFAPPNPGEQQFAAWMQAHIPGHAYRNCWKRLTWFGDPVPLVPPWGTPCYPHEAVQAPPGTWLERFQPVFWHAGPLYLQAAQ